MPSPWQSEWGSRMDLWLCHWRDQFKEWEAKVTADMKWDGKLELSAHSLIGPVLWGVCRTSPGWWGGGEHLRYTDVGRSYFSAVAFYQSLKKWRVLSGLRLPTTRGLWEVSLLLLSWLGTGTLRWNCCPSQFLLGSCVLCPSNLGFLSIPLVSSSGH